MYFHHDFVGLEDSSLGLASPYSLASQRSSVGYGWIRAVGSATAVSGQFGAIGAGSWALCQFTAAFTDALSIDAAGLTGQLGTVTMGMVVDGFLSAGGDTDGDPIFPCCGSGAGGFGADFDGRGLSAETSAGVSHPGIPGGDPAGLYIQDHFGGGVVTFTFGTPFEIGANISLSGVAQAGLPDTSGPYLSYAASMVGDFGNTLTWAGLSDLRDAAGESIPDFSVASLSGTDYRFAIAAPPVPEPGSLLLWAAGLAGLRYATRRRFA